MKLFILLTLLIFGTTAFSQEKEPLLWVRETTHDFGKIPQGRPVFYSFQLTNQSSSPLTINNVLATCGCTTPEWSSEPVPPGGTAMIRVGYNAATEGPFEKPVTITYNEKETKQLTIKGSVWKAPTGSAPANSSIQFLKQQMQ